MWYVIQTTTGKEQELVDVIHKLVPGLLYEDCFVMRRQLLKRLGGKWIEKTETLFPAYVFLDTAEADKLFFELKRIPEYAKLLGNNEGMFIPLEQEESEFLMKLEQEPGENKDQDRAREWDRARDPDRGRGREEHLVRPSRVFLNEEGGIEAIDGPLKYFEKELLRLNLRKRHAVIHITLGGREKNVLLGVILEKDG